MSKRAAERLYFGVTTPPGNGSPYRAKKAAATMVWSKIQAPRRTQTKVLGLVIPLGIVAATALDILNDIAWRAGRR